MAPPRPSRIRSILPWVAVLAATFVGTAVLAAREAEWRVLWPPILALATVVVLRRVTFGLLLGALAGAVLIDGGHWIGAIRELVVDHLLPNFTSSWKLGALAFTMLLGGFAALLEAGGGLQSLVVRFLQKGDPRRHLQLATIGLGFVCFFDGLANSVLLGRVTRSLADRCRVSREKLAYLVDSTSSAVACIAFISTWIATQLTLIREGLTAVGREGDFSTYGVFFASIPQNFYVLFTLVLLLVVVLGDWDFGPMRKVESAAKDRNPRDLRPEKEAIRAPARTALIPLGVLVAGIMGLFYGWEVRPLWPPTWEKTALAFSSADGAWILVIGSIVGVATAWIFFPRAPAGPRPAPVFAEGVQSLLVPLLVLVAAWVLGSVLGELGTAAFVGRVLEGRLPVALLPAAVFVTGAFISFTTGTSWGTMGLLMPLAVPLVFSLGGASELSEGQLLAAVVGAVFSGAVFGDHCSPFSDTTIVAAVATGISTMAHVQTQLPYAVLAAGVALVAGFLPAGAGWLAPWSCLVMGGGILVAVCFLGRRFGRGAGVV